MGPCVTKESCSKCGRDKSASYQRLARVFMHLAEEPGLATLTADGGVGKTDSMGQLCGQFPQPDYQVIYLRDTVSSSVDLYRALAVEFGVRPSHRHARGTHPIVVIDEGQHLSDTFPLGLGGFLNSAFDSRGLLTLWLVGLPPLSRRIRQVQHAALLTRVATEVRLEALDRETSQAALEHSFKAVGATAKIYSDQAVEMIFRASRGVLRVAARLVRTALHCAQKYGQTFLDEVASGEPRSVIRPSQARHAASKYGRLCAFCRGFALPVVCCAHPSRLGGNRRPATGSDCSAPNHWRNCLQTSVSAMLQVSATSRTL